MYINVDDQFLRIVKDGANNILVVKRIDGNKVVLVSFINPDQEFNYSISELNDRALFIKIT